MTVLANPTPSSLTSIEGVIPAFFVTYSALHVITYFIKQVKEKLNPTTEQWKAFAKEIIPWIAACLHNYRKMEQEVGSIKEQLQQGGDDDGQPNENWDNLPDENCH